MTTRTIADGFFFGESPRWHDGELWFTDIHGQRVYRNALDGQQTEVLHLADDLPSGLGWLPDGRVVVVAMDSQQLRRQEPDGSVVVHADLTGTATGTVNDMVVGPDGTAYVTDTGFRLWGGAHEFAPGRLLAVSPAGEIISVVDGLLAPNGVALSDDGRTLLVAEAAGPRLTALTVGADGSLQDRRTFADLGPASPGAGDGICLDVEGAVWLADPVGRQVVRVLDGGEITDAIPFEEVPVACVLAGPDRRTLVCCVAPSWDRAEALEAPRAHLEAVDVAVPGSGRP